MRGIVAGIGPDVDPGGGTARRMLEAMPHRVRAGSEVVVTDSFFAGAAGRSEVARYSASGIVVVADARLDNREELLDLVSHHDLDSSPTTAELIAAAYTEWGFECPQHLLGDYALVVRDERKNLVFCARDSGGVKPLFWTTEGFRRFAAASEIKALHGLDWVSRELNRLRVAEFLVFPSPNDPKMTFFADVFRLPPAHALVFENGRVRTWRHWHPDRRRELAFGSDDEAGEVFRTVLRKALDRRLSGAAASAFELSGGLDSSTLVALTTSERNLSAYSLVRPEAPSGDDEDMAAAVARHCGIEPCWFQTEPLAPFQPEMLDLADEPLGGPAFFVRFGLWSRAAHDGITVLVSGDHGDETLASGAAPLIDLLLGLRLPALKRELDILARRSERGRGHHLLRQALRPLLPRALDRLQLSLRGGSTWERDNTVLRRKVAREVGLREHILDGLPPTARYARDIHTRHLNAVAKGLGNESTDRLSAYLGMDVALPYLDRDVVEFCLALPSRLKYRDGHSRLLCRSAMANLLPDEVRWRCTKGDYGTLVQPALARRHSHTLHLLTTTPLLSEEFVNEDALAGLVAKTLGSDQLTTTEMLQVWTCLSFEVWLRSMSCNAEDPVLASIRSEAAATACPAG